MRVRALAAALGALAGLTACQAPSVRSASPASPAAQEPASVADAQTPASGSRVQPVSPGTAPEAATPEPLPEIAAAPPIVTVQAEPPRYQPPESLKKFRYAKPPAEKAGPSTPKPAAAGSAVRPPANQQPATASSATPTASPGGPAAPGTADARPSMPQRAASTLPGPTEAVATTSPPDRVAPAAELPATTVARVEAQPDVPRYKRPESLDHWGAGRKVPLYADPDAAPWQATPSEPRLQNAAVSCTYKDEGGVRGKAMLLVDNHKLTRFTARIEMPNGGVCQFDSKKMEQRSFEQGIALQSKGDECIVRMWEQKHRITIAAYSCHKQCSKGSFSYLWPIIMDTRVGTCY